MFNLNTLVVVEFSDKGVWMCVAYMFSLYLLKVNVFLVLKEVIWKESSLS